MSLVQRVTSIEGNDYVSPVEHLFDGHHQQNGYGTLSHQRSITSLNSKPRSLRHVLSYDALPQPEEPSHATDPHGGVTAYKVSAARRFGEYSRDCRDSRGRLLTSS